MKAPIKTSYVVDKAPSRESSKVTKNMSLDEASEYLKKLGEWWAVRNCPREIMIKWAMYLKENGAS